MNIVHIRITIVRLSLRFILITGWWVFIYCQSIRFNYSLINDLLLESEVKAELAYFKTSTHVAIWQLAPRGECLRTSQDI